ncbi:MAG: GNAT family N-acetyltransferase [Desulfocapsaceae bacterium]|nr:GNAT family N-acetyltransferase [Desulfocapsaceae bacterium]
MKIAIIKRSQPIIEKQLLEWRDVWLNISKDQPHRYFLSWPWVEHWLRNVPFNIEISLVKISVGDSAAVCLVGRNRQTRHGIIRSDAYYLHYTGSEPYDNLMLEYNQVLTRNPAPDLLRVLLTALPSDWDEFHFPAMESLSFPATCLNNPLVGHRILTVGQAPSYFVDLDSIGHGEDSYLKLLSGNTRNKIRRAQKELNKLGPLRLIQASSLTTASEIFNDLVAMHQHTWNERGLRGAFANKWFKDFHRNLIEDRFESGEIQLLRITCGDATVGCLYNFIYQGTVHYYQSGFNYSTFDHCRPGLICHSLAIPHNAALGHKIYDFLAGDVQYKKSLSTHANQLVWYTLQKPKLRFQLEHLAKGAKAWLQCVVH